MPHLATDSEEALAARLRGSKPGAMQEFYSLYGPGLFAVCSRYIGNGADREDVFQDCLVTIISHIGGFTYRGKGSLKAWATRIAANRCIDFIKEKQRDDMTQLTFDVAEEEEEADPEIGDIPPEAIQEMVMQLPVGYRTVFNLYVFEGKSHGEIAAMLGIKAMSSASQLHRAKNILARKIREYRAKRERQR